MRCFAGQQIMPFSFLDWFDGAPRLDTCEKGSLVGVDNSNGPCHLLGLDFMVFSLPLMVYLFIYFFTVTREKGHQILGQFFDIYIYICGDI